MDYPEEVICAIYSRLSHEARMGDDNAFVFYSEIRQMADIEKLEGDYQRKELGHILYLVNEYNWNQNGNRPQLMLSALAINKQLDIGGGFFELARELGRLEKDGDDYAFWIGEINAVRAFWCNHNQTTWNGIVITYQDIYEATQRFDGFALGVDEPHTLMINGKLYPPQYTLGQIHNKLRNITSQDSQNIFNQLKLVNFKTLPDDSPSHHTFLLTWNPDKYQQNFESIIEAVYGERYPILRWSCGNTKKIKVGDTVFMMKVGGKNGIFMSGRVISEPYEDASWNSDSKTGLLTYIDFEVESIISPLDDTILNPELIDSSFDWTPQRSGISIPPDIANRLENAWYERITGNQLRPSKLKISSYTEGNKKEAIIYRYERDPNARKACIQHFGVQCQVCGFDFGVQFGEIGQGYIQVHHKTPLSERDGQYEIDPINDLVPVCPNCHAMLHRASPPYTIDELKAILNHPKNQ